MVELGGALVASTAVVEGDVALADGVNVWWNSVLRGDDARLTVGERTNIQDLVMVHPDVDAPMTIGRDVTVGHHALLHGRAIGDEVLVGMGAILLAGTVVGDGAIIAAGAVLTEGTVVDPDTVWAGVPARQIRLVRPEERAAAHGRAEKYWREAQARAGRD